MQEFSQQEHNLLREKDILCVMSHCFKFTYRGKTRISSRSLLTRTLHWHVAAVCICRYCKSIFLLFNRTEKVRDVLSVTSTRPVQTPHSEKSHWLHWLSCKAQTQAKLRANKEHVVATQSIKHYFLLQHEGNHQIHGGALDESTQHLDILFSKLRVLWPSKLPSHSANLITTQLLFICNSYSPFLYFQATNMACY